MNAIDVVFGIVITVLIIVEGAYACAWAERADGRADQ
jgi:hypothetical protein